MSTMSDMVNIKAAAATAKHPSSDYVGNTKEFFGNALFSDITLVCGGTEFKLHRIVLATQSPVFAKLLIGGFKEATSNQLTIPLPHDDPETMAVVFKYMYNFIWDPSTSDNAVFVIKTWAAADKYDLPALREVAVARLNKVCDPSSDVDGFIDAIYAVEEYTAVDTLWEVLLPKIRQHITSLLAYPDFAKLIQEMPTLTLKLLGQLDPSNTQTFALSDTGVDATVSELGGESEDESEDEERRHRRNALFGGPRRGEFGGFWHGGQGRRLG